jgi:hypothetical protein
MRSDVLSNLAKIGKIKAEPMNRSEIDRILKMGRMRLEDAGYPQISQEGRFTSVYNALHGVALLEIEESAITELMMLAEKMISDVDQLIGK